MSALASRVTGTVHVIGVGLLGASIALALRERGVAVTLEDISPTAVALAEDYGAGRARQATDPDPDTVVIATPPDVVTAVIAQALTRFPQATVTDVTSVKLQPFEQLKAMRAESNPELDLDRYVGSHPMAGRERGGTTMARTDLFVGRPWVICRDADTPSHVLARVEAIALDVGASLIEMTPEAHDAAVGLVSHVPQLLSSVLAAELSAAPAGHIELAGGGLRDMTRIADSDPELWVQILSANSEPVSKLLRTLGDRLLSTADALETGGVGTRRHIAEVLRDGNQGVRRIPGKHGSDDRFVTLTIIIDDKPGQLGLLLTTLGELGVNMEDLRLEHSPGAQIGFAEIAVLPEVADRAREDLTERGWRIV